MLSDWTERLLESFVPQTFLLHGLEGSGKERALSRIAAKYNTHRLEVDLSRDDAFEAQQELVASIKQILFSDASSFYVIMCPRVDLWHHVHQKSILSMVEHAMASSRIMFIMTCREMSKVVPPLVSRSLRVRCPV
jgi:hypothetical protein